MREKILSYLEEIKSTTFDKMDDLESFRVKYIGKKGLIPALFADFRNVAAVDRKEMGVLLNDLKQAVLGRVDEAKEMLSKH